MTLHRHAAALAVLLLCALAAATSARAAVPGLNVSAYGDARLAVASGAKQVRFFVPWKNFEPNSAADFTVQSSTNALRGLLDEVNRVRDAGATPIMVVLDAPDWAAAGTGAHLHPRDPLLYAAFVGELAARLKGSGPAPVYEVWNEPDAPEFWGGTPDPAFYTRMLQASYISIKAGDPSAVVVAGPTTGNNYAWIEALYANGAKGSFDGVAVHTDTACSVVGPDSFYRDPSGRLGQFTFLGYREVRKSMLANGDDKPIYMSELGWSSTDGDATSCARGDNAGKKPSGVSEATQAAYLTKAFSCLANDPYVVGADVFTLRDDTGQPPASEAAHYGLLRGDGTAKPALAAFAAAGTVPAGECGDFTPPAITVVSPVDGEQYVGQLDLSTIARDSGVGLGRITYTYDGGTQIRNFTDGLAADTPFGLAPWFQSQKLPLGPHTIEVTALDRNGNKDTRVVHVTRVAPGALKSTLTTAFKMPKKVSCKGRTCSVKSSLPTVGNQSIAGKVSVEWRWKNKQGQYRKLMGGLAPATKPFTFTAKLKRKGSWRVRFVYQGIAPYKSATSKYLSFKLR